MNLPTTCCRHRRYGAAHHPQQLRPRALPRLASPRPHLHIELLELLQVEDAGRAVFEEAFVPLFELSLVELSVLGQVVQDLWSQLAVVFPHDASPL